MLVRGVFQHEIKLEHWIVAERKWELGHNASGMIEEEEEEEEEA